MRNQGGKSAGRNTSRKQSSPQISWAAGALGSSERIQLRTADPPSALIETDLRGVITGWNAGAEQLFGYAAAQAVEQPLSTFIAPARRAEHADLTTRGGRGETVTGFETLGVRRDSSFVPLMVNVTPCRDSEGVVVGVSHMAVDLSSRRRVEPGVLRLAAIVESSDDAIVGKDLTGIVFSWNRAAERIFGYTADEMIGRSIRTIIPADRQSEEDEVIARIHRGERVHHFETLRRRKDGSLLPISLTISPIRGPDGIVIGASKIARDITERKQAEAERARLLSLAQEASRLKDEFLATLSHELRTPLNAILGYTRMLRSGLIAPEKQARALDTIERNATSLTEIIEDVLDVSRIISGKIRLNVRPVDLETVIKESLEAVRPAADARGIRIECSFDASDARVSGDPERLQQILWNLVSNAVKFTDRGGQVDVWLVRSDSHLEVRVHDTGIGVAPEFLPYVFERFRQGDSGVTREYGGLGLGLAITKHLVEMHGGTISVSSPGRGAGATFSVRLPVIGARPKEREVPRVPPRTHRAGVEIPLVALRGVAVLAVDDDVDALMMVREILEAAGASVTTADSARQALSLMQVNPPDVLLADVAMPKMSGFELISEVRQSPDPRLRNVPAAALTAYARSEDRAQALRSGFQLHLAKPIDPGELMGAIASLATQRTDQRSG